MVTGASRKRGRKITIKNMVLSHTDLPDLCAGRTRTDEVGESLEEVSSHVVL